MLALTAVAVISLVTTAGTLIQPMLTRLVLDGIHRDQPVATQVALLVGVLLSVAVLNGMSDFLLTQTAEGVVLDTRQRLAAHLLRLPIVEYDTRRTGDLLSRVGADTTLLRVVVTSGLFEAATGGVMVVGAATAMILLDPFLFGVMLAGVVLGLVTGVLFARRIRGMSQEAQARIGEMTSSVERAIVAARTIRASRAEARESAGVAEAARQAYLAGLRMARFQAAVAPLTRTAVQSAFLLVIGVGGARVASGAITVGDLVAFVLFLFFLVMPLGQGIHAYTQLQAGLGALQRIEEVLDLPLETVDDPAPSPVTVRPAGAAAIELDRVSYRYAGGDDVLRDVSFTVPYGSRTALVGPSGAGKSTLLALVERFYDATSGSVRVGGVDVRQQTRHALRGQLGYVEQEAPVLAGTLRDNLLLTAPEASEEQMLAVLETVNLRDIVDRTPLGLDAQVGEGGVLLSGGERQRLAIARALLAAPAILLLDEPTSNLDARNEAALRRAIDSVAASRTLLVVAHRLSTVADADQIVVLERGRVVATGRHGELVDTSPLYRELATHQLLVS